MTTDSQSGTSVVSDSLRRANHSRCVACGQCEDVGLDLTFDIQRPGVVEACFDCPGRLQGYDGVLHGGIICLLLDAAMTNCGFSLGRAMVTGDLQVRFLQPVPTGSEVHVRAWVEASSDLLQVVRSEIRLNDRVMARAVGKFVDKGYANWSSGGAS